jgi:hypothetical protein
LRAARSGLAYFDAFLASLRAAHRRFAASAIAFRPAALSFRFRTTFSGATGADASLASAQRFRCAAEIRALAAALMVLFRREGASGVAAGTAVRETESSSRRTSLI